MCSKFLLWAFSTLSISLHSKFLLSMFFTLSVSLHSRISSMNFFVCSNLYVPSFLSKLSLHFFIFLHSKFHYVPLLIFFHALWHCVFYVFFFTLQSWIFAFSNIVLNCCAQPFICDFVFTMKPLNLSFFRCNSSMLFYKCKSYWIMCMLMARLQQLKNWWETIGNLKAKSWCLMH